jgi:hypothetical protein
MDNRASSLFALVRGREDSVGSREFGFGHRIWLLLVALVLILVIPHSASAQATATLNGVVRDSSGAVISGATVTLHNTGTGTERESLTNPSGLYAFVSVPPGEYSLSFRSLVMIDNRYFDRICCPAAKNVAGPHITQQHDVCGN